MSSRHCLPYRVSIRFTLSTLHIANRSNVYKRYLFLNNMVYMNPKYLDENMIFN